MSIVAVFTQSKIMILIYSWGFYHDAIPDSATYYKSWSGYNDEIVLAAIWIAKASRKVEPEAFLEDLGIDCRNPGSIVEILVVEILKDDFISIGLRICGETV